MKCLSTTPGLIDGGNADSCNGMPAEFRSPGSARGEARQATIPMLELPATPERTMACHLTTVISLSKRVGHIEEIDLGRFVRDKTDNDDVKSFAKMMIDDHNDALNRLQNVLKDDNVNRSTNWKPQDGGVKHGAFTEHIRCRFQSRVHGHDGGRSHQKDLD